MGNTIFLVDVWGQDNTPMRTFVRTSYAQAKAQLRASRDTASKWVSAVTITETTWEKWNAKEVEGEFLEHVEVNQEES